MDKKLGGLLLVFFLLFTAFATIVLLSTQGGALTTFTRAKEDFAASPKASLLFAYPLLVKADGTAKSTINIFVRSDKGMPVKDKKMTVTATVGTLSEAEVTTDDKGKATLTITSTTPGTAIVEAFIDRTIKMSQTLSIKFE